MSEFVKQLGLVGQAAGGVFNGINLLIVAGAVLLGLVVGAIPAGDDIDDVIREIGDRAYSSGNECWPYEFNFETIDGDHFAAYPGINKHGRFELFGDDSSYLCDMDGTATEKAYRMARQARFEHSATSRVFPVWRKR